MSTQPNYISDLSFRNGRNLKKIAKKVTELKDMIKILGQYLNKKKMTLNMKKSKIEQDIFYKNNNNSSRNNKHVAATKQKV